MPEDNNRREVEINYYGVASALIYISVILLFGIPLWWTTTSPSRHQLPDISSLLVSSQRVIHKLPICVVTVDESVSRDELRSQLNNNWPQRISAEGSLAYVYEWKVRTALEAENEIFNKLSSSLADIDDALHGIDAHNTKGSLWVYVLPSNSPILQQTFTFGRHRFAYLKNDENYLRDTSLSESIVELVESTEALSDNSYISHKTSFILNSEIDVIISIISENEQMNGELSAKIDQIHKISDVALIAQSGVSELIRINVISHVLHYAFTDSFMSSNLITSNSDNNARLFDTSRVPLMLNAVESRIVEHNNKQSYNILLYIPSSQPLYFYDSQLKSNSNLILTQYRGGILVWNKANDFVNGFRALIRNLIGLPHEMSGNAFNKNIFFNKWELDAIKRAATQTQILNTLSSLESISKLIKKVGNIVILEEIANRMHTAVDLSLQSIQCLADADLENAFKLSTKAFLSSETAFFDSSLLSLLYFPDDQKYAVYFPLFLPISLPLVSSLYYLFKTFTARKIHVD